MEYNLEERTAKFGEEVIDFCKKISENTINVPLIKQMVRSATSIGANYYEANGASSKMDFRNKIHICKKEAQETKFWLRMISRSNPEIKNEAKKLWQETQELTFIFGKIVTSLKARS